MWRARGYGLLPEPLARLHRVVPQASIDPIYYDKACFLAPDKRGEKPYSLLHAAPGSSSRCAIAKWAWRSKQYVVQVRAAEDGLVL